ncbi:MAG TPA: histidine kinase [Burkholderiaceae bacterium]|nr:histidine kinase [Burkholderiaceae bacterium]
MKALLATLRWRRLLLTLVMVVVITALVQRIFSTPYPELVWQLFAVALLVQFAFSAAGEWPLPRVPRWVSQVIAVVLAAPVATLLLQLALVGGSWSAFVGHRGMLEGFYAVTVLVLVFAPSMALGALYRERDAQAQHDALAFALEKSTLEKQALDARLKLLNAQVEPHFLFNTLANVQELVESGSDRAGPVLASLIAYLRAAIPRLNDGDATLASEVALVRAYLELMLLRMPDRLVFSIDIPEEIGSLRFPTMALLTLVENAVRHGIDPAEQGGRIDVHAERSGAAGEVRISVADTGVGLLDTAAPGTGLANLRERLQVFYGGDARLELTENAPHGVRAVIAFRAS